MFWTRVGMGEVVRATILNAFDGTLQKGERGIGTLAVDKNGGHTLDGRVEGEFSLEVVPNRIGFRILLELAFRTGVFILAGPGGGECCACLAKFCGKNLEGDFSRVADTPPTTFLVLADTVHPVKTTKTILVT